MRLEFDPNRGVGDMNIGRPVDLWVSIQKVSSWVRPQGPGKLRSVGI